MSDPFSHFPSKTGKWKWLKTFARYWTSMFVDTVTITGLYWWKIACYCALFETCNRCSTRCSTASLKTPVLLQCSINVWLHTSFKCYKFQRISRCSDRTLTLAEFRSLLQHCSPATTDALLRLWPHHSHVLRPLCCTGSLTVCGLQTARGNARPHSLQVWDPS